MFAELMALLIFLLFVLILTTVFLIPLTIAAINGVILFLVWYRIYHDKRKKMNAYLISGAVALLITAFIGWLIPLLWKITTFSLLILAGYEFLKKQRF